MQERPLDRRVPEERAARRAALFLPRGGLGGDQREPPDVGAPSGAVIARPNSRTELMTASSADTPRRSCSSGPVIPDTGISRARSHACFSVTTSASPADQSTNERTNRNHPLGHLLKNPVRRPSGGQQHRRLRQAAEPSTADLWVIRQPEAPNRAEYTGGCRRGPRATAYQRPLRWVGWRRPAIPGWLS
jgi:hypothetical protein